MSIGFPTYFSALRALALHISKYCRLQTLLSTAITTTIDLAGCNGGTFSQGTYMLTTKLNRNYT